MPGPYDGYLLEKQGGFVVEARGSVIGTYSDEETALDVLDEHAAGRPKWKVTIDGETKAL